MSGLPDFKHVPGELCGSVLSRIITNMSSSLSTLSPLHEKHSNTAGKMAQWVRVTAAKAVDPDGGRREPAPTGWPLTSSCVLGHNLTLVVLGRSDQVVGACVE